MLIVLQNVIRKKTINRSRPILLKNRKSQALQSGLKVRTAVYRNHRRSLKAVARVSGFQFFTFRKWPRRSAIRFEYEIDTGKVEGLNPRQDMKLRLKI